ncbi:codanin-1-like [Dendronephthya gigantea]|nr:codanin-1-like [Dendronephthya gigantea]
MKKIKPVCADDVEALPSSRPVLQTKLEDNFFRNQPEFLRKDADFVAKRLYQNIVNIIKNDVIPSEIERAKQKLVTETTFNVNNWQEVNKDEFKEKQKILVMKLCNKTADGVLEKISSEVNEECKSRCFVAVQSLSPHNMNEIVIKTTSGIVHQSTMNKLKEWSHQNISSIIEKLVRRDMDKTITRKQSIPENIYRAHAQDCDHPFNWFYQQLLDKECEV